MGNNDDESWPDKGLWEYPRFAFGVFFSVLADSPIFALILLIAVWQLYGFWLTLAASVLVGVFVIWRVVRRFNRSGDPRVNRQPQNQDSTSESN